ncbi:MAG TPA: SPOR domain-containing protein [Acidobacteriaceae bacterium]|nr:SPOR domain-containing protein [Acidobacteriaceae bacterium]
MRTAFEEDEDEITRRDEDDREVTLSSTTVLLIFFGLVLVCGLCFGLGYTLGHRSTPEGAISAPVAQPQTVASSGQPKPSAAEVTPAPVVDASANGSEGASGAEASAADESSTPRTVVPTPVVASTPKPAATVGSSQTTPPQSAPQARPQVTSIPSQTPPQVKPALVPAAQATHVLPVAPSASTNPTPVPAGIMVQVAAISNPTDAQVLVGALRKHGFSASIHTQASDSLLHVQVGPFASRAEAAAMKQKLLSDGYNAILK